MLRNQEVAPGHCLVHKASRNYRINSWIVNWLGTWMLLLIWKSCINFMSSVSSSLKVDKAFELMKMETRPWGNFVHFKVTWPISMSLLSIVWLLWFTITSDFCFLIFQFLICDFLMICTFWALAISGLTVINNLNILLFYWFVVQIKSI